jgi:hypothetical protein
VQYFSPGSDPVPIEMTCIAAEFPAVKILKEGEENRLLDLSAAEPITT